MDFPIEVVLVVLHQKTANPSDLLCLRRILGLRQSVGVTVSGFVCLCYIVSTRVQALNGLLLIIQSKSIEEHDEMSSW